MGTRFTTKLVKPNGDYFVHFCSATFCRKLKRRPRADISSESDLSPGTQRYWQCIESDLNRCHSSH
ncbi:hypothetical protein SCLCIDRAFT_1214470 [Scleroderma citrinum Foug A]|uniref:Uncharacterized protein n=1 Tax=Scleroderma citrinum Foug A TaxID=1036808 RepID=A0A0C3E575_9AGAM|nr:hypothetical protein SCLCIDRAFT_1214470 [Scleroderma citrinum Foug A]